MAFSIKDPETDRIVRDLAERTGLGLTEAVRMAAENELKRHGTSPKPSPEIQAAEFLAWMRSQDYGPDTGLTRQEIEAEMYDEYGVPR
uniref:type II toxin-antitoxin system VapB family antitoxin n=1 Tax=uncultured Caulobacter sp. TaxID=158749 RepID=UPI0025D3515B|nr:type II toxin-antitoxin system VapB family antitoxin [uncultured Caulobacter sp.]